MSLKEHTVKSYDKDLQSIAGTLEEMAELVLKSIDMVAEMIIHNPNDYLEKITSHDYKINSLDFLIERKITTMLALRQPMAVDLRYIVSALKVSSNLERVGDQAKSIIKKIDRIGVKAFDDHVKKSLLEMVELSKIMVRDSIIAFNDQDSEMAEIVLKQDDKIDAIYSSLFVILEGGNFSKEQAEKIINILFIAKSFERLADHSTNIAEITKYVATGETK
ncbi:MAG: phosphate transport system regulatory protein PhoU [Proteobacteria bacterium]|nr:phosphate transport system regulatory protein PhoU [Pseudomonadota bacterium]